jgi:hypothetical protein
VFVAVAVNVYAAPAARPVTSHDPDAPATVHVLAVPPTAFTVKDAGAPPVVPAATVTVTFAVPATTVGAGGVPGAASNATDADAADAAEVPAVFVAVAVNVYAAPAARPVTSHDPDAPATVHVLAVPPTEVTFKDDGRPPVVAAATVTVTFAVPATPVGAGGVPGTATTLTTGDPGEKSPVLVFLVKTFFVTAATLNEYVPTASPVAVHVSAVDDFVAPLAHPVPAPVHGPPVPDAT